MDPNLMSGIIGAVSGLIGAFGGAWVSWKIAQSQVQTSIDQRKLENIFSMHKEFHGESMNQSRIHAAKLIEEHPNKTLNEIDEETDDNISLHLWIVFNFYQRLSLMVKHKQTDERYVAELFGALFFWWWLNCFEGKIPSTWESYENVKMLKEWIEVNASKPAVDKWKLIAQKDKDRFLKATKQEVLPPTKPEVEVQVDKGQRRKTPNDSPSA